VLGRANGVAEGSAGNQIFESLVFERRLAKFGPLSARVARDVWERKCGNAIASDSRACDHVSPLTRGSRADRTPVGCRPETH
jgi:hypothetical protein